MEGTKEQPQLSPLRQRQAKRLAAQQKESKPEEISRRGLLKGALGLVGLAVTTGAPFDILSNLESSTPPPSSQPITQPPIPPLEDQVVQTEVFQIPDYLKQDYKLLNESLELSPEYPEPKPNQAPSKRQLKEKEYVERCLQDSDPKRKLERIDRGLMVIGDYRQRIRLIEERWKLRQEGQTGLRMLTDEEITWAANQNNDGTTLGIHPEVLAICTDAYFQARELLLQLQTEKGDKFLRYLRPDLYLMKEKGELPAELEARLDNLTIDEVLMNPGGMAELVCRETDPQIPKFKDANGAVTKYYRYGIAHIGHVAAKPQLKTHATEETDENKKERELQESSLTKLIGKISEDTKIQIGPNEFTMINYNEDRVIGSEAQEGDIRAGALGFQFMPFTALAEYDFNKQSFGKGINPFGLEAIVGAYIMLTRGTISVEQSTGYKAYQKFGYLRGTYTRQGKPELGRSLREDAIDKWNSHQYEINKVLETADNYYEKIIKKGVYEGKIVPLYKNKPLIFTPLYKIAARKAA
ncbi:hypothetical protein M1437_04255 [Patescibacteria group bacterium]|nr:hypothetical protein [Patescibacteria group bacterium]